MRWRELEVKKRNLRVWGNLGKEKAKGSKISDSEARGRVEPGHKRAHGYTSFGLKEGHT